MISVKLMETLTLFPRRQPFISAKSDGSFKLSAFILVPHFANASIHVERYKYGTSAFQKHRYEHIDYYQHHYPTIEMSKRECQHQYFPNNYWWIVSKFWRQQLYHRPLTRLPINPNGMTSITTDWLTDWPIGCRALYSNLNMFLSAFSSWLTFLFYAR